VHRPADERWLVDVGPAAVADFPLIVLPRASDRLIGIEDAGVPGAHREGGRRYGAGGRKLQRLADEQRWSRRGDGDRASLHDHRERERESGKHGQLQDSNEHGHDLLRKESKGDAITASAAGIRQAGWSRAAVPGSETART